MKAVLFVRVSTPQQTLEQQEDVLRKLAHREGYHDSDIHVIKYKESAIKLSIEERQGLQDLKNIITNNKDLQCVFVYELSRISRQQLEMIEMRDFFIEHEVNLIVCDPYFRLLDNKKRVNQSSNMLFSIYSTIVEQEMKQAKARMIRGKHFKQQQGFYVGGDLLFGYTTDSDNKIIVDENLRQTVNALFKQVAIGNPIWNIALQFYEEAVMQGTRRSIFCKIRRMIHNLAYSGRSQCNTKYPMIVSCEIQDEAIRVAQARCKPHMGTRSALLQGLIKDADTGRTFTPRASSKQYFIDYGNHNLLSLSMPNMDTFVWDIVKQYHDITDKDKRKELIKTIDTQIKHEQKKLNKLYEDMGKIRPQYMRASELYIEGMLSKGALDATIKRIDNRKNEIKNNIIEKERTIDELNNQRQRTVSDNIDYSNITSEQQREIVQRDVNCIKAKRIERGRYILDVIFYNGFCVRYEYYCRSKTHTLTKIN